MPLPPSSGRRAVKTDRAGVTCLFQPMFGRYRRADGAGTEQIVSAGMRCALTIDWTSSRCRRLRYSRQRVVLGEDRNHRTAGAETCYKRGGNPRYSGLDPESLRCQRLL